MPRGLTSLWIAVVATAFAAGQVQGQPPAAPAAGPELRPADVEAAIQKGVRVLRNAQLDSGEWDEYPEYPKGMTAICTLSLLSCGVSAEDPAILKALRQIRGAEMKKTYSIAVRTLVLCQVGRRADLALVSRDVQWLIENQRSDGGWGYGVEDKAYSDESCSQFAILALDAAEAFGVNIPPEVWTAAERYWNARAAKSGGWSYRGGPNSGSMTCAGIASLVIVRGRIPGQSRVKGDQILCCQSLENQDDPAQKGLEWLASNFSVSFNPGVRMHWLYYMYALERTGRLTGKRFIGDYDWYRMGAAELIKRQRNLGLGDWVGEGHIEKNSELSTAFALLFLSKGKRQVLMNRAEYANESQWNVHPGALRQLTRSVEKIWARDLTWQSVRLKGAKVTDLLQAPVLFLSGPEPLNFDDQTKELLRDYVQKGGFIFAEAVAGNGCGDPKPFEDSLRQLCQEIFNAPLERLPKDHPIWQAERPVAIDQLPPGFWLYGVQSCCRTALVYTPTALSCRWELHLPDRPPPYSPRVNSEIDAAIAVGQNVVAYATGRQLRDKLDTIQIVDTKNEGTQSPRQTVVIPRMDLGGGGEQAPRALPNLLEWMHRSIPIRVKTDSQPIGPQTSALQKYALVFVHGRDRIRLQEAQHNAIAEYLNNGGVILANSICGGESFTQSFKVEMKTALPDLVWETLPPSHPIFGERFHGFDISRVRLRSPAGIGQGMQYVSKTITPVIEVGRLGERAVILFSPYDLSCALENQKSPQCTGYETEDAAKIGINMVLYALGN